MFHVAVEISHIFRTSQFHRECGEIYGKPCITLNPGEIFMYIQIVLYRNSSFYCECFTVVKT